MPASLLRRLLLGTCLAFGALAAGTYLQPMAGAALAADAVAAPAAGKSAVDVLFETKHLTNLTSGAETKYRFQRAVTDEKMLGAPYSDDITLAITKLNPDGTREVTMKVFTGERARDPEVVPDLTGNPVLVFFLDRAVNNFSSLAGGNRNYLKGKFREGLREKSKIAAVKIDYNGKPVDGWRITVAPFDNDPNALRMLGYEGAEFTFLVSEALPGHFGELASHYESGIKDAPKLDERVTLAGVGGAK